MEPNSVHTKDKIFSTALRLFAINGYENVSVRTIADVVGIKVSSIYNHFENKEQILEACYKYYIDNRYLARLGREQYEPIIKNGTKDEIIRIINYEYHESVMDNMIMALLVVFSRIYTDTKASDILADEINNALAYQKEFFWTGIEVGRFAEFDIEPVGLIYLGSRMFYAQCATLKPEQRSSWRDAELSVNAELLKLIPFKY